MKFWKILATVAPFAALAIPGVGPAIAGALHLGGGAAAAAGTKAGLSLAEKLLIGTTIAQAGTGIVGAKLQANAAKRASDTQTHAADEALQFERTQYDRAQHDYDAWLNGGDMMRLGDMVRRSPGASSQPGYNDAWSSAPPTTFNQMRSAGSGQTPAAAGGMVTLQAPNGQTKQVSAALEPHYTQRGARVVG